MTLCPKCGGSMERGRIEVAGALGWFDGGFQGPRTKFLTGEKTSNPLEAFRQGMDGESADFRIAGVRCSQCGFLEL